MIPLFCGVAWFVRATGANNHTVASSTVASNHTVASSTVASNHTAGSSMRREVTKCLSNWGEQSYIGFLIKASNHTVPS
jgi:hypothetical protein